MATNSTDSYTTSSSVTVTIYVDYYRPTDNGPEHYHYLGNGFNGSMMAVNFLIAVIAIPLNMTVMSFYRHKLKETTPFMYFSLSTSDLLTGISGALHSIIFLFLLIIGPANSSALYYIAIVAYLITIVSFRVSALVSLIFAAIRTVAIVMPTKFKDIKPVAVIVAIVTYCLFWLAFVVGDTALVINVSAGNDGEGLDLSKYLLADFFVGFFYSPANPKFLERLYNNNVDDETRLKVQCGGSLLYTGFSVSFLALLAFIAMIIQVSHILGKTRANVNAKWTSKVTVTIILITLVFVVCSTLALFQPLFIDCSDVVKFATTRQVTKMLQYSFGYLPFFLNAALNPLILIARVEDVKWYALRWMAWKVKETPVTLPPSVPLLDKERKETDLL